MRYNINLRDHGQLADARLDINGGSLTFCYKDLFLRENDIFPFRALKAIRKQLELHNILLLIYGNRIDVWPSGMFSYSNYAHIHIKGQMLTSANKVDIFVFSDENIGTIDLCEEYQRAWTEEIKSM